MATLDLWLDDYSDIYSDFDSRQYLKRRVSEDFVDELRLSFAHKEAFVSDIILQIPAGKRDDTQEPFIAESLHTFFKRQQASTDKLWRRKRSGSWLLVIGGIIIMTTATFVTYKVPHSLFSQVIRVVLEPAGWFFVWRGLEGLFSDLKKLTKERKLYSELATLNWRFKSIGN